MKITKADVHLLISLLSTWHVVASPSDWDGAEDDDNFQADLQENGLTLVNVSLSRQQYGGHSSLSPAQAAFSRHSGEEILLADDQLFMPDYGLSRYKRDTQGSNDPIYSGSDNPCDTNTTLCSGLGHECVFDSDSTDGYLCQCRDDYEQSGVDCVEVPESKKLYLTTILRQSYDPAYNNHFSMEFIVFQRESQDALSQAFTGLDGYKTLRVVDFRNRSGETQVVFSILYQMNISSDVISSAADRVLTNLQDNKDIQIGSSLISLNGYAGIFRTLSDSNGINDAVDWCSSEQLYKCDEDRKCRDGGITFHYSCDCKTGFDEMHGMCIAPDKNTVQYDMYPYGSAAGDTRMVKSDDDTEKIFIQTGFPVGDQLQYLAYVGINGLISFGSPNRGLSFTLDKNKMMFCPYLSDIDTLSSPGGGEIYYHLYSSRTGKETIFDKADSEVQEFVQTKDYHTKLMLIVTWDRVSHHSSPYRDKEHVTFQAVLVSDGSKSYGLVYYKTNAMNWEYRPNIPLVIGISLGAGRDPKQQLISNTPQAFNQLDFLQGNTGRRGMWVYEIGEAYSADQECEDWYQRNLPSKADLAAQSSVMPQCPCTMVGLSSMWVEDRQIEDITCYRLSRTSSFRFQPYSKECCFRRMDQSSTGTLVEDLPSAGGLLAYNPVYRQYQALNTLEDLQPHDVCCFQAAPEYCSKYYELRPTGNCSRIADFALSVTMGDPHIITLDGRDYTFNGWGEYTLVKIQDKGTDFRLQGRTNKTFNNDTAINATVFNAFAATDGNTSVFVELEPTDQKTIIIYVDDKDYTLRFKTETAMLVEEDLYTLQRKNSSLLITFTSGISLSISVGIKLLDIGVRLPVSFKRLTKGLMGNFNGDPTDDFVLPNGTVLNNSLTEQEIFYQFGNAWAISDQDSVFPYESGKDPDSFRHPDFRPIFLDSVTPEKMTAAQTFCGQNHLACIYDFIATGSAEVAMATNKTKHSAEETTVNLKNTAPQLTTNASLLVWEGQSVVFQLVGTDVEDSQVTYFAADTARVDFQLDSSTGKVNYTANSKATNGNGTLAFYVEDTHKTPSPLVVLTIVICPACNTSNGECDPAQPQRVDSSHNFILASCKCQPWYQGDLCQSDFNGCADNPCISGQNCTDVPADEHKKTNISYNCSACPPGYAENGSKCRDENECLLMRHKCAHNCSNVEGSYQCYCMEGYRLSSDGFSCNDINECAEKSSDCEQICINGDGNVSCSCYEGYQLEVSKNTCVKKPQVNNTCQGAGCEQGCRMDGNSSECFCYHGYTRNVTNSGSCIDEDECRLGICAQTCENSPGSFACSCYAGFYLHSDHRTCLPCPSFKYGFECSQQCACNGRSIACNPVTGCVCEEGWEGEHCQLDIDECLETPAICNGSLQICVNTNGSYDCQCMDGYENNSITHQCQDIDECSGLYVPCGDLEDCYNTAGSFYCTCRQGYYKGGAKNCTDIDECSNGDAQCQHTCINNQGSFKCTCKTGFRLSLDRKTCEKVEEVCAAAFNCSFECTLDAHNLPYCFCSTGYRLASDLQTCNDIDECKESAANCSHDCTNQPGSFRCDCPVGMRLENDQQTCSVCGEGTYGKNCSQHCECGSGSKGCDPKTGCICRSGWTGLKCDEDIDECHTISVAQNCSSINAQCENFPGGYRCRCSSGYRMNESANNFCEDINECDRRNECSQRCENTPGSFRCLCNTGFSWNSTTRQCDDIDECRLYSTNNCTQNCENTFGGYRCTCDSHGFELANDGITCKGRTQCRNDSVCDSSGNGGCVVNATNGNDTCFCNKGYLLSNNNTCLFESTRTAITDSFFDRVCWETLTCTASKARNWCNESGCEQHCHNITSAPYFTCSCDYGYRLSDDGLTCTECPHGYYGKDCSAACSCSLHNSRRCLKENGTCVCNPGWTGGDCSQDVDECSPQPGPCGNNSTCHNSNGSYICVCHQGFFYSPDDNCTECADGFYDDCSKLCPCDKLNTALCDKKNGSCLCQAGWHGTNCSLDIDECTTNQHNCSTSSHQECRNKDDGFECVCEIGYQMNKTGSCVECANGFYDDCSKLCLCDKLNTALCDKKNGSCLCQAGWQGTNCSLNIDECTTNQHNCSTSSHQECRNKDGGFECVCETGYQMNKTRNCVDEAIIEAEVERVPFGVTFNITIENLAIILNDTTSSNYSALKSDVEQALTPSLNKSVDSFIKINIKSMREGSLIVNMDVLLKLASSNQTFYNLSKAMLQLRNQTFSIMGQTANVIQLTINDTEVRKECEILISLGKCVEGVYCEEDRCARPLKNDESISDLIIGLAVGIPLFIIAVIVIAFIVYVNVKGRHKRWHMEDEDGQSHLSGMMSRMIVTRGALWNPRKDMYSPDNLSPVSSGEDRHSNRMNSQRPQLDLSPWRIQDREIATATEIDRSFNFSWDFFFNQHTSMDQPFSIKRPKVTASLYPAFETSLEDS